MDTTDRINIAAAQLRAHAAGSSLPRNELRIFARALSLALWQEESLRCTYAEMAAQELDRAAHFEVEMRAERLREKSDWLAKIEALKPGDACEFRYPARKDWILGVVKVNGGTGYWTVGCDADGRPVDQTLYTEHQIYIEHVRLPGQTEAWPEPKARR